MNLSEAERKRRDRQIKILKRERPRTPEMAKEISALLKRMEAYTAADCGLTPDQWWALPEVERNQLEENSQDEKFAKQLGRTLKGYRSLVRPIIESRARCLEEGRPQWVRDSYAKERPQEVVLEYLDLLARGAVATGDDLLEVVREINSYCGSQFTIAAGGTFEEARARLFDEIQRAGLMEFWRAAVTVDGDDPEERAERAVRYSEWITGSAEAEETGDLIRLKEISVQAHMAVGEIPPQTPSAEAIKTFLMADMRRRNLLELFAAAQDMKKGVVQ